MKDLQLNEISFKGHTYTWKHGDNFERDTTLCTLDWQNMYPSIVVHHTSSDHYPILLEMGASMHSTKPIKY